MIIPQIFACFEDLIKMTNQRSLANKLILSKLKLERAETEKQIQQLQLDTMKRFVR